MADPLFVFLVSGDPDGHDDGFAKAAWLRVTDLVAQFFKDRKKPGALVKADTVLRFIHFDTHAEVVGIYEHDFAKQKGKVRAHAREIRRRELPREWTVLDATFTTAHPPLDTQKDPKTFVEWKAIKDKKEAAEQADSPTTPNLHHALSIVDVYHSVRKAPRGSILEVSIVSHSFADGPVLTNTFAVPGSNRRSPDDTDGRAAIDFQSDMGENGAANKNALIDFRNAFTNTGTFRIWGCNIQDLVVTADPGGVVRRCLIMNTVRQVVEAGVSWPRWRGHPVLDLDAGTATPPGNRHILVDMDGELDDEIQKQTAPSTAGSLMLFDKQRLFEIRYDEDPPNHVYHPFINGARDSAGDFAKTINPTLSDMVKFVAGETMHTYTFAAAKALQAVTAGHPVQTVAVFGAPSGTSAEIDSTGQQFVTRLDQAKFVNKFLGVDIVEPGAPVKRHYAILDRQGNAVKTIEKRAVDGLP